MDDKHISRDNSDLFATAEFLEECLAMTESEEKAYWRKREIEQCLANALDAFEAEDWMAGLRFAKKTNMKDARIQYCMGCFYEDGFSLERCPCKAAAWYRKAASQGHEDAQRRLDRMQRNGHVISFVKDVEIPVLKRCREAAERGDAEAQVNWGLLKFHADNIAEAIGWFRKSAAQGNAKGLCCMGTVYEEGHGVGKDIHEALRWYRMAAERGDYVAMAKLDLQYKVVHERYLPTEDELRNDYVKAKDGKFYRRVKTGNWLPLYPKWARKEMYDAIDAIHHVRTKNMSKGYRAASLGDKIFGKEGPEHEGYGTGALQKWADKMVVEGKDPYEVNLLEWFKGASDAFDYHMGRRTFEELLKKQRSDSDFFMRGVLERMQDFMPELERMSRARIKETIKQKYYTIRYAPYGRLIFGMLDRKPYLKGQDLCH